MGTIDHSSLCFHRCRSIHSRLTHFPSTTSSFISSIHSSNQYSWIITIGESEWRKSESKRVRTRWVGAGNENEPSQTANSTLLASVSSPSPSLHSHPISTYSRTPPIHLISVSLSFFIISSDSINFRTITRHFTSFNLLLNYLFWLLVTDECQWRKNELNRIETRRVL